MTDEERKREAEVAAAALLLLSKRATHTIQLALLGAARRGSSAPLLATRDDVEASVAKAVAGARSGAQALAGEAFARQTGVSPSSTRRALGTGRDASGSLADQWATRAEVGDSFEQAARDLDWAAARTAKTEVFSEYSLESREAFDSLAAKGVRAVRIWKAQLEACPMCRPLHDTEADAFGQFPYGDPLLHVNCMCFVITEVR
jgi:predicted NUDIX family NTP pyrophosphohydrolase